MSNEIFTVDDNNNAAVRTVSVTGIVELNKKDIFTKDENGNAAVRVVGGGGGGEPVDYSRLIIKSSSIPTAGADEYRKVYMYVGTTNSTYTHGYIYECIADVFWEANIAFEKSTFASEDFDKAGQLMVDAGVVDPSVVASISMTYALAGNLWSIVFKDGDNNTLNTPYNIYTDDLEQDYDILPVVDPSTFVDGQVVNGSINNIVQHLDNYRWNRVDVQPQPTPAQIGAVTQSTSVITLNSADWSSHAQTKTVSGVTASNTVIVSPAAASASDYAAAEILCTAQAANSLTFSCTTDPANNISVNVVILS